MADSKSKAKDERTADEIRRDIAATRARLAAGVENLVSVEPHPPAHLAETVRTIKSENTRTIL